MNYFQAVCQLLRFTHSMLIAAPHRNADNAQPRVRAKISADRLYPGRL